MASRERKARGYQREAAWRGVIRFACWVWERVRHAMGSTGGLGITLGGGVGVTLGDDAGITLGDAAGCTLGDDVGTTLGGAACWVAVCLGVRERVRWAIGLTVSTGTGWERGRNLGGRIDMGAGLAARCAGLSGWDLARRLGGSATGADAEASGITQRPRAFLRASMAARLLSQTMAGASLRAHVNLSRPWAIRSLGVSAGRVR